MITRQTVISALVKLKDAGIDVSEQFESLKKNQGISKDLVEFLRTHSPQFMFYKDLQKNQKALIKNILDYESFDTVQEFGNKGIKILIRLAADRQKRFYDVHY